MGEVMELGGGLDGSYSLISAVVSLIGLGVFAVLQDRAGNNNDDDDSTPGGGLMQPVGSAA